MKLFTALAALTLIAAPALPAKASGTLEGMYFCDARAVGVSREEALRYAIKKAAPPVPPIFGSPTEQIQAATDRFLKAVDSNSIENKVHSRDFIHYIAAHCPEYV